MSSPAPTTAAEPEVLLERDGPIARVTLNRPRSYNAMNEAMIALLASILDEIAADEALRVVVLGSAGAAFSAGHDMREMRAHHDQAHYRELFDASSSVMKRILRLPQPVIARVHGIATAAGCQLVGTCDLAVASSEATFAVSGVNLGLFCSTPSVALVRNVARKRAFELLVTGEFVDAATAAEIGLVNRVAEPDRLDAVVDELAGAIVAKPPVAIRTGKRLFYRQIEADLDIAYAMAAEEMACNMMDPDTVEGIDAFLGKRPPRW